jgi:hypothetical protein
VKFAAAVIALVLLFAFGSYKQQEAELTVQCGTVSGGMTTTAKGAEWARKAGDWLHNVAANPEDYREPEGVKKVIDGVFKDVLWFWLRSAYQSARGEKIDPQILRLQEEAAQAKADALAACCPPTPAPEQDDPPAEEWDPRNASFQTDSGFTNAQLMIAAQADQVRRSLKLPTRASVVILAAGFQESGVQNLNYGDRDSLGWLQQRSAWAPRADRMNPAKAARMFFTGGQAGQRGLMNVRGWEEKSITQAVYAVQVSAFPNAAAQFEDDARKLLAAAGGTEVSPDEPESPGYTAGACTPTGETIDADTEDAEMVGTPADFNFRGQRTVDAAIAWMRDQDRRNTGGWQNRCLAAVGQAYGHQGTYSANGTYYAVEQYAMMPKRYQIPKDGPLPRGALVFRRTGAAAGHISISNGDGREWTTDPPGRSGQVGLVSSAVLDGWGARIGASAPWFPGKTGGAST